MLPAVSRLWLLPCCRSKRYLHIFCCALSNITIHDDYLSVEDACEVSLPQLTRGQTPLEVGDVALEVDQGLVVFLHVGLQAVAVVVVLTRPTVPHNNVKNGLTLLLI